MTYRSADGVLESRLADVDRELATLRTTEEALREEVEREERLKANLAERFALTGHGGAHRGPTFDRIGLLIAWMCVIGVLLVPAEVYIASYVRRQPEETVIPVLLLAGPGLMATIIAWPYRRMRGYGLGAAAGVVLATFTVVAIAVGWFAG